MTVNRSSAGSAILSAIDDFFVINFFVISLSAISRPLLRPNEDVALLGPRFWRSGMIAQGAYNENRRGAARQLVF